MAPGFRLLSAAVGAPVPAFPWVFLVTVVSAMILAARVVDNAPWASLGLGEQAWQGRALLRAAGFGAIAISGTLGLLWISGSVSIVPGPAMALGGDAGAAGWSAAAFRLAVFLAPAALWEELVFRGYLWTVARDAGGMRVARWTTAVAFGLLHITNPGSAVLSTVVVILAGWCLGAIREFTDSVPAAFVAHFVWNWMMAAVAHVAVSGAVFEAPGYQTVLSGSAWWTGGVWGPEGGGAALIVLSVGVLLSIWYHRPAPSAAAFQQRGQLHDG